MHVKFLSLILMFIISFQNSDSNMNDLIGEWCLFHTSTPCHVNARLYKKQEKVNIKTCIASLVIKKDQKFRSNFYREEVTGTWMTSQKRLLYLDGRGTNKKYAIELKNDTLILHAQLLCGGYQSYSFKRKENNQSK